MRKRLSQPRLEALVPDSKCGLSCATTSGFAVVARLVNWLAEAPELLCKRSHCCWPDKKVTSDTGLGWSVHEVRCLVAGAKLCSGRVCFCNDSMRARSLATCSHRIGSVRRFPTLPRVEASDQVATPRGVLQKGLATSVHRSHNKYSACARHSVPQMFS